MMKFKNGYSKKIDTKQSVLKMEQIPVEKSLKKMQLTSFNPSFNLMFLCFL